MFAANEGDGENKPWYEKGTVYGKIFANVHSSISADSKEKGFEVKRAYFGYKADLNSNFSGNIKLDIGNPSDVQDYAAKKRFAYFKNAYFQYKINNFNVQFGIADSYQFKVQEKFWGYRYIYQSFQDKYGFGSSADIGVFSSYKFNDMISADISFVNGEGYSSPQSDENFKGSLGATIKPIKPLTLRVYVDSYTDQDNTQYTFSSFVGLKLNKVSFGGEYNYQINNDFNENNNLMGFSAYSTFQLFDKLKVFGRYDYLSSNIIDGDEVPWNLSSDGSAIIAGIEYSPLNAINFSLNYQDWIAYASDGTDSHFIYFNVQFAF
jgi:hypothetical protein